jgi:hypothetical protein
MITRISKLDKKNLKTINIEKYITFYLYWFCLLYLETVETDRKKKY